MAKIAYLMPKGERDSHDQHHGTWTWCMTDEKQGLEHPVATLDEAIQQVEATGEQIQGWIVAEGCLDGRDLRNAFNRRGMQVPYIHGALQGLHVVGMQAQYTTAYEMREQYLKAAAVVSRSQERGEGKLRKAWDLEMKTIRECWAMMDSGMRVDVERLDRMMEQFLNGCANKKEEARFYAVKDLYDHMNDEGVVHPTVLSVGTVTGRITTRKPNIQGASHDTIRPCLMPISSDSVFISADYPQIEAWIAAKLAGDDVMLDLLNQGDLHRAVASKVFKKAENSVSQQERDTVKQVVYGVFYGIGAKESAARLGVSVDEAESLKKRILAQCPNFAKWVRDERELAIQDQDEYVELASGRRRWLKPGKENYWDRMTARINGRIQGACADILKSALVVVGPKIREMGGRVVLPVHDEIFCEAPRTKVKEVQECLLKAMSAAAEKQIGVAVKAKASIGENFALESTEQVAQGRVANPVLMRKGEPEVERPAPSKGREK